MYGILALGYEFLSQFVPFLIVLMLFRRTRGKYALPFSMRHFVLPILFAIYIIAVFYVTDAGTIYDAMTVQFENLKERINLIPFSKKINVIGYCLNIVMFVPLGFFVPLIWEKMGKPTYIILTGFFFSLMIEITQLLSYRGTDVDDVILNTAGAVVGFLLYKIWDKITKSMYQSNNIDTIELPAYILALYLGRCLLFNRLGLIHLIYGN